MTVKLDWILILDVQKQINYQSRMSDCITLNSWFILLIEDKNNNGLYHTLMTAAAMIQCLKVSSDGAHFNSHPYHPLRAVSTAIWKGRETMTEFLVGKK